MLPITISSNNNNKEIIDLVLEFPAALHPNLVARHLLLLPLLLITHKNLHLHLLFTVIVVAQDQESSSDHKCNSNQHQV